MRRGGWKERRLSVRVLHNYRECKLSPRKPEFQGEMAGLRLKPARDMLWPTRWCFDLFCLFNKMRILKCEICPFSLSELHDFLPFILLETHLYHLTGSSGQIPVLHYFIQGWTWIVKTGVWVQWKDTCLRQRVSKSCPWLLIIGSVRIKILELYFFLMHIKNLVNG